MIRPSQLQIAEKCGLAPVLAAQFPETSEAASRGTRIHEEIANCLRLSGCTPTTLQAAWALEWLAASGLAAAHIEHPVVLTDPESGEEITSGTADLIAVDLKQDYPVVIDWKSGRPESQPPVEESLQLAAYAIGYAIACGAEGVAWRMVFVDERVASPVVYVDHADMWPWIARIKAAATKKPEATPGEHCGRCYQRKVCGSYRERATTTSALVQLATLEMTSDVAREIVLRLPAIREACDMAEEMAKAYVRAGGDVEADGKRWGPAMVAGRRSGPSVKELEEQGLGRLVKQGSPSERWSWRK